MSYGRKVPADQYSFLKKKHEDMNAEYGGGMPFDAIPVDLYGGFVPLDKNAQDNLEKTMKCNEERFGLEMRGT